MPTAIAPVISKLINVGESISQLYPPISGGSFVLGEKPPATYNSFLGTPTFAVQEVLPGFMSLCIQSPAGLSLPGHDILWKALATPLVAGRTYQLDYWGLSAKPAKLELATVNPST